MKLNYDLFVKNVSFDDYEKLQKVKDFKQRMALVKKAPYVLPLVLRSWNDKPAELNELIETGILCCKDFNLLSALKEKEDFKVLPEFVNASVYANPKFIFELNEEEKKYVSRNALIDAFIKDCRVINSGCPELKKKSVLISYTRIENGIEVRRLRRYTLRSQLLSALRIATQISVPSNKGYDSFAIEIAKELKKYQKAKKIEKLPNVEELMNEITTVMNGLIKKQHQMVRLCKGKALKLNNNKVLHSLIKEEAKESSKLKGLHNDIPKMEVSKETFERAIVKGIKLNYKFFNELEDEYKSQVKFQVAYLKSIRDNKFLSNEDKKILMDELFAKVDEKNQKKLKTAYNRSNGAKKAALTKKENQKKTIKIEAEKTL